MGSELPRGRPRQWQLCWAYGGGGCGDGDAMIVLLVVLVQVLVVTGIRDERIMACGATSYRTRC